MIRVWIAPYTAGPDVPQFAGFADTFLRHGLCFFHHVGVNSSMQERWPYSWPYPYGVLPALLLALARTIAPHSYEVRREGSVLRVYTPSEWTIALKSIYIASDIASALFIYFIISAWSRKLAILATTMFYLNPLVIYVSSIFGQLDPVATALFLAGILIYLRYSRRNSNLLIPTGALIGLSATSKPNMLAPAGAFIIYSIVEYILARRRTYIYKLISGFFIGAIFPFLVFEASCPGGLVVLYNAISDVGRVGYYYGLHYSFNGFTSLASYMHFKTGRDFLWMIENWWVSAGILTAILFVGILLETRSKRRLPSVIHVFYLVYLIYLSTYWKIHYQYFVGLVALFSILVADREIDISNKILAGIHTLCLVIYLLLYPTSFWAWYYVKNPNSEIIEVLNSLSLRIYDEEVYLVYSLILTFIGYLVIFGYTLIANVKSSIRRNPRDAMVNETSTSEGQTSHSSLS